MASPHGEPFDPALHREPLLALVREVCALLQAEERAGATGPLPAAALQQALRRHPKQGRGFFSRSELLAGFRAFAAELGDSVPEASFVQRLQLRPVRTQSGVTPVTVLTKPFPCPGKCVFCPNDLRMPKSYLSREPGCQRAEQNGFDPYLQTWNRLRALSAIGHSQGKAELIVLGGTFSFYPEAYQRWFVKRCFDALNDLGAQRDGRAQIAARPPEPGRLVDARDGQPHYNRELTRRLGARHGASLQDPDECAGWEQLEAAQRANETAAVRNVGLSVETRPDHVDEAEVLRLRRLGCTKIQIGLQSLSDRVLALNRRGHDVGDSRRALRLLRAAGFKLQVHVMLNLLGSTPEQDIEGYAELFADPDFRPDELKVYPCSLIDGTELMRHYESRAFVPYERAQLLRVLKAVLRLTPRYARLSRVIRDISSEDIFAGNRLSNFREIAEAALAAEGLRGEDIRSREIKHAAFDPGALELRETVYPTSIGEERFLELATADDRLAGFVRLSLPAQRSFVPELAHSAVIRELHVYGTALAVGARGGAHAQHRGLGRQLLQAAAQRAAHAGYSDLAVISAVGTRPYYRRFGFSDGPLYQHKGL